MLNGFLGTSASIMLDVVVVSLALVVPVLAYSIYLARGVRNFGLHKKIQLTLGIVLAIVVALFEIDMRLQGGFWELAKDSPYADSRGLAMLLGVHLTFSITTVIFWAITYGTALKYFSNPVVPNSFSPAHKALAWISVADMVATVITGLLVYYFGFGMPGSGW